jgi:hypothetical protein
MFWPSCLPVLAFLFRLNCPELICQQFLQTDLSWLTFPGFSVLGVLSLLPRWFCIGHPVPSVLILSHLSSSCPSCPLLAVLPRLACLGYPAPAAMSGLFICSVVSFLPCLSCHNCHVPTILSSWPVPPVLSQLLASALLPPPPSFPVLAVISMLSCPDCPVHLFCQSCPVLDA